MYLEALRNPFYRQQMMMNQQITALFGQNGAPGGMPFGFMGGGPMGGFPGVLGANGMGFNQEGDENKGKKKKKKKESRANRANREQELQLEIEIQVRL